MPENFNPWAHTAQNISSVLMQLPAMRARARQQDAQAQYYNANAQQSVAQAGYYDAQRQALMAEESDAQQFGSSIADAFRATQVGDHARADESGANAMIYGGRLMKRNPERGAQMMGDFFQKFQAMRSQDPTAQFAGLNGKPVPGGSAVTGEQWQGIQQGKQDVAQIRADAVANRPIAKNVDEDLVSPTGEMLRPGNPTLRMGETLFSGQPGVSYTKAAEGAPGPNVQPAPAGSYIIDRQTGQVINKVPSAANPYAIDPGSRTKLQALGSALSSAYLNGEQEKIPVLTQQIDALSQRSGSNAQQLDPETAAKILQEAGGDKNLARKLAKERGYSF